MEQKFKLIELVEGLDITIQGDPNCIISGVNTIQNAKPGQLSFLINPLYKKYLPETQASAVILSASDADTCLTNALIAKDPYYAYAKIAAFFDYKGEHAPGIHKTAVMGENCKIDPSASIGPHVTLGNHVKIGANVVIGAGCFIGDYVEIKNNSELHSNVSLYNRTSIGKHVVISSGVVIGSDGFGIAKHQGAWHKVPQLGRVVIQDNVEIGANCTIDRGAIEDTVIEYGVRLDNLIQVGHNVRIGEHTAIAGCVGIAGSAVIGKNCLIGGGAGIAGHISITDNVVITGMTAVTKTIKEPGIYSSGVGGLLSNLEWRKNSARIHRLEHLMQRVKTLEDMLERKEK